MSILDVRVLDKTRYRIDDLAISKIPKILRRTKSTLLFRIKLSEGKIDDRSCVEVESGYTIRHRMLSKDSRDNLTQLISRTLVRIMNVYQDNDLEDTKKYASACTMSSLIGVGLVSALNGDLYTAKILLDNAMVVAEDYKDHDRLFRANMKGIVIPLYFNIILKFEEDFFVNTRGSKNQFRQELEEYRKLLDVLEVKFGKSQELDFKRVATHFIVHRDPSYTRKLIRIDKDYNRLNIIQRFDKAFIYLYEGRVKESYLIYYRLLKNGDIGKVNINYVYNYIDYILWDEPDKYQLLLSLIMINHFCRDSRVAKDLYTELQTKHREYNTYKIMDEVLVLLGRDLKKEEPIYILERGHK